MNTIENNKLITEFLKVNFYKHPIEIKHLLGDKFQLYTSKPIKSIPDFHSDWNWLMEVVEKIESIQDQNKLNIYNVDIVQSFVEITNVHTSETIVELDRDNKKLAVYCACLEFIKWHHKQNS